MWRAAAWIAVALVFGAVACLRYPGGDPSVRITEYPGIDCTAATDSRVSAAAAIAAAAGKTVVFPDNCKLGLSSPGAGNAAITVGSHTTLRFGVNAGFVLGRRVCKTGTYVGAECTSDAECQDGGVGSCRYDYGSDVFAPTRGATYTVLKDSGVYDSESIVIEGLNLWIGQAGPFPRCLDGANAGYACRTECSPASVIPGMYCDENGDCSGGSCLRLEACPNSTCTAPPASAVGAGKVIGVDLTTTRFASVTSAQVFDHFSGEAIKVGRWSRVADTDTTAELTGCTTPFTGDTTTVCRTGLVTFGHALAGRCCYGPANSATQPSAANVTVGITAGDDSSVERVKARGATAIKVGQNAAIRSSQAGPLDANGPGQGAGGFEAGAHTEVRGNVAVTLGAEAVGIKLTGAGSDARYNRLTGGATGILLIDGDSRAIGNRIASAGIYGVLIQPPSVRYGYEIRGNVITSSPAETLDYGIYFDANASGGWLGRNAISHVAKAGMVTTTGWSWQIVQNKLDLSGARPTASLAPIGYMPEGTTSQAVVMGNIQTGGYRGVAAPNRTDGLANTIYVGNRFIALSGASFAIGGAGIQVFSSYQNSSGGAVGTLVCDATCGGGSPTTRGTVCQQDADCTANGNTCSATYACIPEPLFGFLGSPYQATGTQGAAHDAYVGNIMFDARPEATKQAAGTATNPGAYCQVTQSDCTAQGGTCAGDSPSTCTGASGDANNKFCSLGASSTCTVRSLVPILRLVDWGAAAQHVPRQVLIANNQSFGRVYASVVFLDLFSTLTSPNLGIAASNVSGNIIDAQGGASSNYLIRFPVAALASGTEEVTIQGNVTNGLTAESLNWRADYGPYSIPVRLARLESDGTHSAKAFGDVQDGNGLPLRIPVKANRMYHFDCEFTFSSSSLANGIGFAVSLGGVTPTSFAYLTRLPRGAIGRGAGAMSEQQGNGDDETSDTTRSVGATGTDGKYLAAVRGNLAMGATAGYLTARVRSENNGSAVTIYRGSNCRVEEFP